MHRPFLSLPFLSIALPLSFAATQAFADTLPRGSWVPSGMVARVQDSALQLAADELEPILGDELEAEILSINNLEIFDEGCWIAYTAYIDHVDWVTFDQPSLTIDSRANSVFARFEINNLEMWFVLDGKGALCLDYYDCVSVITIDRVVAEGQGSTDVVGGHAKTTMNWVNASVEGYQYDTEYWCFIIDIIADILQETLEDELELMVEEALWVDVPENIDEFFLELELDTNFSVFDVPFGMELHPDAIVENASGVTMSEEGRIYSQTAPCGPRVDDFLYTPNTPPAFGATIPGTSDPYDFAISISDDALNEFLYSGFDSGAFCFVLDENSEETYGVPWHFTTTDLQLFFPELYAIAPDAATGVTVVPRAAPYTVIGETTGILVGQLEMFLQETEFTLWVDIDGTPTKALVVAATADADFLVRIRPDGLLKLLMSDLFNSTIVIEDEPLVDLNDPVVEMVLPFLLRQIVPLIFLTLDAFEVPLIYGFQITPAAVINDGVNEDYLSFYSTLAPAE